MGVWAAILWTVLHWVDLASGRSRGEQRPAPTAEARAALDAHDFEHARSLAAESVQLRPRDPAGWLTLGLALFRAGRAAEALPAFGRVTELDPRSSIGWFNLGSARYQTSDLAAAGEAYHRAAALDAQLAPLALYDASLAAHDAGRLDAAERDLTDAAEKARGLGQDKLKQQIDGELSSLARERERALTKQGKAAIQTGRPVDAIRHYRAALDHARARGAGDEELAELDYGLGHALLRNGEASAAAEAFADAARQKPHEADFRLMLGMAEFRASHDEAARDALKAALALGLSAADSSTARAYLAALGRDRTRDRLTIDVRAGGGWDSNVPQSAPVLSAGSAAIADAAAGFLSADLDLLWRVFGKRSNGVALDYHFGQLAYLSSVLDTYSLQEHDLGLAGAWSPRSWLTFELGADGFIVFSGVQTFTPFQAGITPVLRALVREGHNLETQARFTHTWKASLDKTFDYLAGNRDEVVLGQQWTPPHYHLRLYAGYQFTSERIGVESVPLHQIMFPLIPAFPVGSAQSYLIPYSYQGHEARVLAQADPHRDLRLTLDLRYEKLFYTRESFIRDTQTGATSYHRARDDDRFTLSVLMRWALPKGFELAAAYTLVVNRSDIDFRNPATALDYDDKNYLKHVVALEAAWRY